MRISKCLYKRPFCWLRLGFYVSNAQCIRTSWTKIVGGSLAWCRGTLWYYGTAVTSNLPSGDHPTSNFHQGQTLLIVQGDSLLIALLRKNCNRMLKIFQKSKLSYFIFIRDLRIDRCSHLTKGCRPKLFQEGIFSSKEHASFLF